MAPYLVGFAIFMQLLHWTVRWSFSVNTSIHASAAQKADNNVIIIGAGFSGLGVGCLLKMAGIKFVILEKAQHVGGTWWYNDYPGAAVDVKSHTYCYSFFSKRMWKDAYSFRDEILQYIQDAVHHFALKPHLRFKTIIKNGEWDPKENRWSVHTTTGEVYKGRFLVNCMGFLHKPNIPKISGMEKFKGRAFHTAMWEHDYDYTNKRIAVIGSGCSAIQVVPELAKVAKELTMFQRSAGVIAEKVGDGKYSVLLRTVSLFMPWTQWLARMWNYFFLELFYWAWEDNFFGRAVQKQTYSDARSQIKNPELAEKILFKKDEVTGCKRPGLYTQFYRKFEEGGVKIQNQAVTEMTETGIKLKDGSVLEVDLIVFATGYDMFHYKDVPMVANGKNFHDFWEKTPYAFNGVLHPNFPNYFMLLGPQTGQIHGGGSVYYGEMQAELIMNIIRSVIERNYANVCLKESKMKEWIQNYTAEVNGRKKWLKGCTSWYITAEGIPWQPYVWNSWTLMASCKWPKLDELCNFGN